MSIQGAEMGASEGERMGGGRGDNDDLQKEVAIFRRCLSIVYMQMHYATLTQVTPSFIISSWTVLFTITLPVVRNTSSRATLKLLCTTRTGIRCRSLI
jgi:hypothetical protein